MISTLLDRLEERIDHLETLIGPWDPRIETQEDILSSLEFLERSVKTVYSDVLQINDKIYHELNCTILNDKLHLDETDRKEVEYKVTLYNEDMEIMNQKLKQLGNIYTNKFLKNISKFNEIPSHQLFKIYDLTKEYKTLEQLLESESVLIIKTMAIIKIFVERQKSIPS